MRNLLIALIYALLSVTIFGQVSLRGSMGINFMSTPSVKDYINQNFAPSDNQVGTFNTAVNFSGEVGYSLKPTFQIGLEAAYTLTSFTYSTSFSKYELSYGVFSPTLTAYYVVPGKGYNFKFGGGIGPRFVSADETIPPLTSSNNYKSTGLGFLLRAEGNTALSSNFFANIGADLRYDLNGEPKSGGNFIYNNASAQNVNFNSLAFCLRLGVTYFF